MTDKQHDNAAGPRPQAAQTKKPWCQICGVELTGFYCDACREILATPPAPPAVIPPQDTQRAIELLQQWCAEDQSLPDSPEAPAVSREAPQAEDEVATLAEVQAAYRREIERAQGELSAENERLRAERTEREQGYLAAMRAADAVGSAHLARAKDAEAKLSALRAALADQMDDQVVPLEVVLKQQSEMSQWVRKIERERDEAATRERIAYHMYEKAQAELSALKAALADVIAQLKAHGKWHQETMPNSSAGDEMLTFAATLQRLHRESR